VKRGDYLGVKHLVPDAMVETFVVCGSADEVRRKIEPVWEVADSLTLVPPAYAMTPDQLMSYGAGIAGAFYL
jgi:hypothetical protein